MGKYKGGNGGIIVNMSSVAGLEGIPIAPIYGGTQYAIVGFTQSLKVKKWNENSIRIYSYENEFLKTILGKSWNFEFYIKTIRI